MAQPLKRLRQEQETALFTAYSLLSNAGFQILIEDGQMTTWLKYGDLIENDFEEGFVIVPKEYRDEFNQRQDELEEEETQLYEEEENTITLI